MKNELKKLYLFNEELKDILKKHKNSSDFNFNIKKICECYERFSFIDIKKDDIVINLPENLNPEDEYIPLDYIVNNIIYHLKGFEFTARQFVSILKAISYHGFYGLWELFEKGQEKKFNDEDLFYYFRQLAKYYRNIGDFEKSQQYYRKTLLIASKDQYLFAYSLSLQAKQFSDYLQRESLSYSFSKIAYERLVKIKDINKNNKRWSHICIDTYAKNVYSVDPKKGSRIYKKILKQENIHPFSLIRIKFRFLELRIYESIKYDNFELTHKLLKVYELELNTISRETKTKYVRTINFLKLVRKASLAFAVHLNAKKNIFSKYKNPENELGLLMIDDCIKQAYRFKDRKFIAISLYEKSFWLLEEDDKNTDEAINCLVEGIKLFQTNKSSIINKIYSNILNRLAHLHDKKSDWQKASIYYHTLFGYITDLRKNLENDRLILDEFINNRKKSQENDLLEFVFLSKKELNIVKTLLIIDYENLLIRLMDYGKYINAVQNKTIVTLEENVLRQYNLIGHQISGNVRVINDYIDKANEGNSLDTIKENINSASKVIKGLQKNIQDFKDSTIQDLINPKKINITKEFNYWIKYENDNSNENVQISMLTSETFHAVFPTNLVKMIVSNLTLNAIEIGHQNKIPNIKIESHLINKNKMIYLLFSDNCMSYVNLDEIIKKLNEKDFKAKIDFGQKRNRGNGLTLIKDSVSRHNEDTNWELLGNEQLKTIKIPLYKEK